MIFLLHGRCQASELFVAIFGGVVAMKKGGKKYIIYVVSNSYVISNFYLEESANISICVRGNMDSIARG